MFDILEDTTLPRLLKRAEVVKLVGTGFPTIWQMIREGKFPQGFCVGGKTCWRVEDIREWMQNLEPRRYKPLEVEAPPQPQPKTKRKRARAA
jgi:predicted DNA-binding transcriptional regulator AlpA